MRVTLERSNLLKSLNHVQRVVERRTTIPILSNVLLHAEDGQLRLRATDLDLEVTDLAQANVEQSGATSVPAHMLYDIVRKLPDGAEVMLSKSDSDTMNITSGRAQFHLQTLPESDFPDMTAGEFSHSFDIQASGLKLLIDRTQFAISTEETRYYLNGIYFHNVSDDDKQVLRAVATDGHRLARAQIEAPKGCEDMPGIIIPKKAVGEFQRLLEDIDGVVKLEISDTKIRLTLETLVLTSKLIDGTFPDYNRVIPDGNDKKLTLERSVFTAAVDRVSTVSADRGRAVKLSLTNNQLTLSVNNPDSGSAEEEISVEYTDDDLEIGFNSRYLLDITSQLTGEQAVFMLADPGSPTLIHDAAENGAIYVLMPMRV